MAEGYRSREQVLEMWDQPFEDLSDRIMKSVGAIETAKAILNARAIVKAAHAGLEDSKALVNETRRLVSWTRGLVFATIALVLVDLIFRLVP